MALTEASPRSVRLATAALLVLTFGLGTVTGAGIYHVAERQGPRGPAGEPPPFPPLPLEKLDLSKAQQERIREILEAERPEVEEAVKATFPKLKAINAKIEAKTREVLTPAQRKKLDEFLAQHPPRPEPRPGSPSFPPPPPWGVRGMGTPPPLGGVHPPVPPGWEAPENMRPPGVPANAPSAAPSQGTPPPQPAAGG